MCYSGKCYFEDHMGECRVRSFKIFEKELGERACYVGGAPDCEEAEQYIAENQERFKELIKQAREKGLTW